MQGGLIFKRDLCQSTEGSESISPNVKLNVFLTLYKVFLIMWHLRNQRQIPIVAISCYIARCLLVGRVDLIFFIRDVHSHFSHKDDDQSRRARVKLDVLLTPRAWEYLFHEFTVLIVSATASDIWLFLRGT